MLEAAGLSPQNVVLEITERHSIRNFTLFYKTLAHYRGQGYKIAIDDAGTGYSGLSSIAEITPDFIKVDMSLIRGINRDPVRRALMETMISLADKIGSRVIAEGIETREEAMTLAETGAPAAGQSQSALKSCVYSLSARYCTLWAALYPPATLLCRSPA
jgi:EAL domain-containing protein (putative c-di-GMP-specific phosphodiesterase class I)